MDLPTLPSLTIIVTVIGLITVYAIFRATHSGHKRPLPTWPEGATFFWEHVRYPNIQRSEDLR